MKLHEINTKIDLAHPDSRTIVWCATCFEIVILRNETYVWISHDFNRKQSYIQAVII